MARIYLPSSEKPKRGDAAEDPVQYGRIYRPSSASAPTTAVKKTASKRSTSRRRPAKKAVASKKAAVKASPPAPVSESPAEKPAEDHGSPSE